MVSPPPPAPPRVQVLHAVMEVMGAVADERAIEALLEHVGEPPWSRCPARQAVFAIAARVPAAAPALVAACVGRAGPARTALEALARIRHPEASALLVRHAPRLELSPLEQLEILDALDDPGTLRLACELALDSGGPVRGLQILEGLLRRWLRAQAERLSVEELAELCRLPDQVGPDWVRPQPGPPQPVQPSARWVAPRPSRPRQEPWLPDWRVDFAEMRRAAQDALRARGVTPPEPPAESRRHARVHA